MDDERGLGSTFTVELPLDGGPLIETSKQSVASLKRRILMVDDSAESFEVFAELLRMEGAEVDTATRAAEALQMLAHGKYDLLLSHIGMPDMSGMDFVKRVRALPHVRRLQAVALSGYGSQADRNEVLAAGFDAHLSKPVTIERLRAVLEERKD